MIGAGLVAKQRFDVLSQYFVIFASLAITCSICVSLAMIFGRDWFTNLFYSSTENRHVVLHYLNQVWWVAVAANPLVAVSTIFQNMLFSFTEFKWAAGISLVAAVVGYIPLVITGKMLGSTYTLSMAVLAFLGLKSSGFIAFYFAKLKGKELQLIRNFSS